MFLSPHLSVVVPDLIIKLITMGAAFVVAQGVKEVLALLHVDLSGYAAAAVALIVTVIVATLNGVLGQIPLPWQPLASELLNLLVLLLSAVVPFGFFRIYRGLKGY